MAASPPSPALPYDPAAGDSPLLALARQDLLLWHQRRLTAAFAASCWPLPAGAPRDSNIAARCALVDRATGQLMGLCDALQVLHCHVLYCLFARQEAGAEVDGLLPHAPGGALGSGPLEMMTAAGIAADVAAPILDALARDMDDAALRVRALRDELAALAAADGSPPRACALPLCGTLRVVPAATQPAGGVDDVAPQAFLIYEPDAALAARFLVPLREREVLPAELPFGAPIRGCYKFADRADAREALARAGAAATPSTVIFPLNEAYWRKLALLYRLTAADVDDPRDLPPAGAAGCLAGATRVPDAVEDAADAAPARAAFLQRLFCVLARHNGGVPGSFYAGAVPHSVFDALERRLGVAEEGFASPLNAHFPRFCSPCADTDAPFGSRGSFFSWRPAAGSFQCNPPFVDVVMNKMVRHMEDLLAAAERAGAALSFAVVGPSYAGAAAAGPPDREWRVAAGASRFFVAAEQLESAEHQFIDGSQPFAPRDQTRAAFKPNSWVVLATSAVRARGDCLQSVRGLLTGREPGFARVFKFDV